MHIEQHEHHTQRTPRTQRTGCTAGAHAHCVAQSVAGGQHKLRVHSRHAAGGPRHHSPTSQGAEKHRPMCTASVARVHACDPIAQWYLCACMMVSYHDLQLIPCVLIAIRTLMCISLYEQVMPSNAASASATASRHACGATSGGGRVVSGSFRSGQDCQQRLCRTLRTPDACPGGLGSWWVAWLTMSVA